MHVHPGMLVREITTAYPASLRKLEWWGIDYCCGGGRRIEDACARAGVPVADVLSYVETLEATTAPAPESDFRTMPLTKVLDHIVGTHHVFTRNELDRATGLADKVHRVHGARHPELARIRAVLFELREELLAHMMKEERVLFPMIEALEMGAASARVTMATPIGCMAAEHEDAGLMLEELKVLTRAFTPPDDACGSYRTLYRSLEELDRDLRVHMHVENDIVFPRALAREAASRSTTERT